MKLLLATALACLLLAACGDGRSPTPEDLDRGVRTAPLAAFTEAEAAQLLQKLNEDKQGDTQ